jgi:hypothetical protein
MFIFPFGCHNSIFVTMLLVLKLKGSRLFYGQNIDFNMIMPLCDLCWCIDDWHGEIIAVVLWSVHRRYMCIIVNELKIFPPSWLGLQGVLKDWCSSVAPCRKMTVVLLSGLGGKGGGDWEGTFSPVGMDHCPMYK